MSDYSIITVGRTPIGRARSAWRRPLLNAPRHVLAVLLVTPVAAGAAACVGLWWYDSPPSRIHTLSEALIAGGRVTGLLGAYLLLVQVALMARIPWLERRIGSDWLARAHRWVGAYLVSMLVAHALLLVGGLTLLDRVSVGTETLTVVLSYPDVLMATVALALLVGVGALSAQALRQRLPYELWHFTHLYAYLAVALAFAHQLAVGADLRPQAARLAWTAAHLAVLACVLRYRVGDPLLLAMLHRLRVHAVAREADGVVSIYVTGHHLDLLRAEAGRFFRWRFLSRETWLQAHPFSLSAPPTERMLRLTVKAVGDHTEALQRLRPGVHVLAEGPYGALTGVQRTRRRVLLIAGGIGITPMRALLEALPGGPGDITLLYRGDTAGARVFAAELEDLAAERGVLVHYLLGPRPCCAAHDPLTPRRLARLVPDVASRDVYVCGSPGMMAGARRVLRLCGVLRRHIHAERFDL
jgi:predicted ferric reductase